MKTTFRSVRKRTLQRNVPEAIVRQLEQLAVEQNRTDNQVVTEVLCLGLGVDPARFGIDRANCGQSASPN